MRRARSARPPTLTGLRARRRAILRVLDRHGLARREGPVTARRGRTGRSTRDCRGREAPDGVRNGTPDLRRPSEAADDLSAAQRRVQQNTITPAILAGTANRGHSAEARRVPKPRVGSSSLSRATSEFKCRSWPWTSCPILHATTRYTRGLRSRCPVVEMAPVLVRR